jgi:hypothetical protein
VSGSKINDKIEIGVSEIFVVRPCGSIFILICKMIQNGGRIYERQKEFMRQKKDRSHAIDIIIQFKLQMKICMRLLNLDV